MPASVKLILSHARFNKLAVRSGRRGLCEMCWTSRSTSPPVSAPAGSRRGQVPKVTGPWHYLLHNAAVGCTELMDVWARLSNPKQLSYRCLMMITFWWLGDCKILAMKCTPCLKMWALGWMKWIYYWCLTGLSLHTCQADMRKIFQSPFALMFVLYLIYFDNKTNFPHWWITFLGDYGNVFFFFLQ